jgi:hypothetical protein
MTVSQLLVITRNVTNNKILKPFYNTGNLQRYPIHMFSVSECSVQFIIFTYDSPSYLIPPAGSYLNRNMQQSAYRETIQYIFVHYICILLVLYM